MHSLINTETVNTIRSTGNTSEHLPDRIEVLTNYQLPYRSESRQCHCHRVPNFGFFASDAEKPDPYPG